MSTAQIIATLGSLPFVLALVALVRRFAPSLDGVPLTTVLALVFAGGAQILGLYAASIPQAAWVVIGTIVSAVLAVGGTSYADRLIDRHAGDPTPQTRVPTIRPPIVIDDEP